MLLHTPARAATGSRWRCRASHLAPSSRRCPGRPPARTGSSTPGATSPPGPARALRARKATTVEGADRVHPDGRWTMTAGITAIGRHAG
jgi:hypothetical protein